MRILLDQNLSHRLASLLAAEDRGPAHVRDVGRSTVSDPDVWAFAATRGFVIASKDADFQQRAMLCGHPPKVLWARLGNCPTAAIANLFRSRLAEIRGFEADPVASFPALS